MFDFYRQCELPPTAIRSYAGNESLFNILESSSCDPAWTHQKTVKHIGSFKRCEHDNHSHPAFQRKPNL